MEKRKNILKQIVCYKPSFILLGIGAVAVLLLLLAPLIRLGLYAAPWYDDFNYGGFARRMMEQEPGIVGALKGAWECARVQWFAWQGTFSSIFFMALTPLIWGEEYYWIGSVFLILILTVSVFVFTGTLAGKVLHTDRRSSLCLQTVMAILAVELVYGSPSAFYWYNPGIHYIGMHSFALLFFSVCVCLYTEERVKSIKGALLILGGMLGALLAGGSNFVTALQTLVVLGSLLVLAFVLDRRKILRFLPIAVVFAVSFYKCVSAPGNQVRGRSYVGWGFSPVESVLRSFLEAFLHLWEFTGWVTILVLILLVPVIWQLVQKSDFSFKLPGLVLLWSFGLYAAGFTPSLYSLGHAGLSRALNAVKITFQILLVLNEVYWIGWLKSRLAQKGRQTAAWRGCPWWFYVVLLVIMHFVVNTSANPIGNYSSWGAYYYIHTGEAYNFYSEYQQQLVILKSDETDVVLEPYLFKPWMLCLGEVSTNPEAEENRAMADWYDKDSIVLREEP